MPKLPDVPQVLQFKYRWTVGLDTTCFTTLHFHYTGTPPSNSDCIQLATHAANAVLSGVHSQQGPWVTLTQITCTDLSSDSSGTGVHPVSSTGTAVGGQLPASACVLMNYLIQRRYRGGKPRTYWPMGTDTDLQDPQTWKTASVTAFQNAIQDTLLNTQNGTWAGGAMDSFGSVSYVEDHKWSQVNPPDGPWKSYPVYRAVGEYDQISTSTVNPRVGTQRRRITGKR